MPAKANVPVDALPWHPPLSGAWPPPTGMVDAPPVAGSGPRRLGRRAYEQGESPLYIPPLMRHPAWEWTTLL